VGLELPLFLGTSPGAEQVRELIRRAARVDSAVLITGESGVGKELVAREIHLRSARRDQSFRAINCSAIPDTLIESEIFGHEAGAFTGARGRHRGVFELADAGTLFLDEVGDLSPGAQPKLLRVLETGELARLGSEAPQRVDVRLIAATNHPLRKMVKEGRFREDLYYRLCVFEIRVTPLRDRRADVPILARHFVSTISSRMGRDPIQLTDDAIERLSHYPWPGNVRELKHAVESAMAMSSGFVLGPEMFDLDPPSSPRSLSGLLERDWKAAKEGFEAAYVRRLLTQHEGNVTSAARAAGLARRSFYKILRRLGLHPDRESS